MVGGTQITKTKIEKKKLKIEKEKKKKKKVLEDLLATKHKNLCSQLIPYV